MSGSQQLLLGGAPTVPAVDPYFYSVTSLLHGDGTNGGQNNTFLDSSSNNFTITRNGNTTQGSFSPFSQTGWGNYFSGSANNLTVAYNSAFQPNTYVSLECWVYFNSLASDQLIIGREGMWLNYSYTAIGATASKISFGIYNTSATWVAANSTTTPALNQWYHIVGVRDNTTLRIYINGVQEGTATFSGTPNTHTSAFAIGGSFTNTNNIAGYISNARYCNGATSNTLPYTGTSFTVPTSPLTVSTNTILLTCQSNRFVDNSGNAYAITANGSPSVQPFSPFNPTTAYSASSIGGSGYFDGSGDYLTVPDNAAFDFGSGDFTISAWVYPQGAGAIIDQGGGGASSNRSFEIYMSSASSISNAYISSDGNYNASYNLTGTTIPNAWNFIEFTRSSGTIRLFVNGTLQSSAAANFAIFNSTATVAIGNTSANAVNPYTGYISDVRVLKGTGSASSTVPTAPLTAIANTQLLCNFTNGAIFDNAAVADYETVGNAQISTSVKKYGTGSMSFDGTGDGLTTSASGQSFVFGTGDFTIEGWVYLNTSSQSGMIYDSRPATTSGLYPTIRLDSGVIKFYTNSATQITGSTLAASTWYHFAVCRVASQTKLFVNGTQVGSTYADTNSYLNGSARPLIGADGYDNYTGTNYLNGYVDDLRISKGVGRYAYNFTPPTAELPNIGGPFPTLTADPYYEYTTLLLPGNGTNGAQNNTFLDSSTNAFSITRNGNTTQGTFSPFSQTGWSNNFDGSGDYLTFTGSSALTATGDFTFECWIYVRTIAQTGASNPRILTSPNGLTLVLVASTNNLRVDNDGVGASPISTANNSIIFNQWMHVAVVRSGSTLTAYLNGTAAGSATHTSTFTETGSIGIGYTSAGPGGYFDGYISNMRMVVGTAVYTANFTPPTAALTAITNTQLLTCQSNRFVDNSSNAFAITANGDVSVQAFSPFNPTASWSAATYGGSGYFDGSGDYLTVANNAALQFGTGDFTVECWAYVNNALSTQTTLFSIGRYDNGLLLRIFGGSSDELYINGSLYAVPFSTYMQPYAWAHIAVTRSGSALKVFVNGSVALSTTNTANIAQSTNTTIGAATHDTTQDMNGYMSDFRIVKGTAVYTAAFTPPTAPLTAIANTQLLTNFTNAGIYDATSKNDLETVGNAQISTTQSKFGGSSMYFDGTGDYLFRNGASDLFVIDSDYTVECWVYFNSTSGTQTLVNYGTVPWYLCIGDITAGKAQFTWSSSTPTNYHATGTTTLSTGTWYHIAGVRYGSNIYLYVNGIREAVTAIGGSPRSPSTNALAIGAFASGSSTANAYIQDLRITKGIARYTSNFTPPTTAFLTL